jgi:hypothetical protein
MAQLVPLRLLQKPIVTLLRNLNLKKCADPLTYALLYEILQEEQGGNPSAKWRARTMDYNEFDDYGTGYEEAAEAAFDAMIDAEIADILDRSCADKTCWVSDRHDNDCLPF